MCVGPLMHITVTCVLSTTAPSGPPQGFSVSFTEPHTGTLSWAAPAEEDQNGVITGYTLSCLPGLRGLPAVYSTSGSYTFDTFTPAMAYSCLVYASTVVGEGPSANITFTTPEDGK